MYNSFVDNPIEYEDSDYESLVRILVDITLGSVHGDLDNISKRANEMYKNGEINHQQYNNIMDYILYSDLMDLIEEA